MAQAWRRNNAWPNWTGLPFSPNTSATTPEVSALISFMTFIASMMQTTVSGVTESPALMYGGEFKIHGNKKLRVGR